MKFHPEKVRNLTAASIMLTGALFTGGWAVDGDGSRLPRWQNRMDISQQPQQPSALVIDPQRPVVIPLDLKIHLGPGIKADSLVYGPIYPFLSSLTLRKNIFGIDMLPGQLNSNYEQARPVYTKMLKDLRGRNLIFVHSLAGALLNSALADVAHQMDPQALKDMRVVFFGCGDKGTGVVDRAYKVYQDPEKQKMLRSVLKDKFEIFSGEKDEVIPPLQSVALARYLGDAQLAHYYQVPNLSHGDIIHAPAIDEGARRRIIKLIQS